MSAEKPRAMIAGTGAYLPERVMTNRDFEKILDTSDEWIFTRTGIRERRIADPSEAASDMGAKAALRALEAAAVKPDEVDLIIAATMTPDHRFPSTAALIQHKIGATKAGGFDLQAACAGFMYGLSMGAGFIAAEPTQTVLVVGTDMLSRFVDWSDRSVCIIFGDGAGAAVLRSSQNGSGMLSYQWGLDGSGADLLKMPAGGSACPINEEAVRQGLHYTTLEGRPLFRFAVNSMMELVPKTVEQAGLTLDDIKLVIPHQVNMRVFRTVAERLGMPLEKIYSNIDLYGNTAAASLPIALNEAVAKGLIERGDNIVCVAFGGGLSWASSVIRW